MKIQDFAVIYNKSWRLYNCQDYGTKILVSNCMIMIGRVETNFQAWEWQHDEMTYLVLFGRSLLLLMMELDSSESDSTLPRKRPNLENMSSINHSCCHSRAWKLKLVTRSSEILCFSGTLIFIFSSIRGFQKN